MSTNHTTNYQLSQWEPGDPVLRADFNADNQKVEAALKALNTSVQALNGKQSSLQMINISNGSGQSLGVTPYLPQKEKWSEWDTVCVLVSYHDVPSDVTLSLQFIKDVDYTIQNITPLSALGYLAVFFPRHSADSYIWGFIISDHLIPVAFKYSYNQLLTISAEASKFIPSPDIRTFGWK